MAIFSDLAVELQETIWRLVLPASRGMHWIEVEGIPHEPDFVRESIRMTKWFNFDRMPEGKDDIFGTWQVHPDFMARLNEKEDESSFFFQRLLTTVPAVFGSSGPSTSQLENERADEIAYTRRCRQLSTYTQIATLLSTCRLSRYIAQQHIKRQKYTWPIFRSMGSLYRPRPMKVWESQYNGEDCSVVPRNDGCWEALTSRIHALDLVVFRLHDCHGKATALLRQAPWQYFVGACCHGETFGCYDRIALEWHPSFAGLGGDLRSHNVRCLIKDMSIAHFPATLYWLVDGVPRPDWERDYPAVVSDIFSQRMLDRESAVRKHLRSHWALSDEQEAALLADHHLGQEFEANGRRYYIVFVVCCNFDLEEQQLADAGLGHSGPFPGSASMWPEAIRDPVRLASDVMIDGSSNMGTLKMISYILSWEPI